jgi:hypothetical protein
METITVKELIDATGKTSEQVYWFLSRHKELRVSFKTYKKEDAFKAADDNFNKTSESKRPGEVCLRDISKKIGFSVTYIQSHKFLPEPHREFRSSMASRRTKLWIWNDIKHLLPSEPIPALPKKRCINSNQAIIIRFCTNQMDKVNLPIKTRIKHVNELFC